MKEMLAIAKKYWWDGPSKNGQLYLSGFLGCLFMSFLLILPLLFENATLSFYEMVIVDIILLAAVSSIDFNRMNVKSGFLGAFITTLILTINFNFHEPYGLDFFNKLGRVMLLCILLTVVIDTVVYFRIKYKTVS